MDLVVDASALVAVLTDRTDRGRRVAAALEGRDLVAPSLLPYEVLHAIRRFELQGELTAEAAWIAVRVALAAPIDLMEPAVAVPRIWELRRTVTPYDAAYVALAERLAIPLLTLDRRLARAPGIRCEVLVPA